MNSSCARSRSFTGLRRPLAFIAVLTAALPALAELSDETLLGAGLRSRPAYDGSASQHTEAVPVVRYLGETWFLRSTQGVLEGGLRTTPAPGLHAGAQLAYEPGRRAGESAFLQTHGASSIGAGASAGVQLEWDHQFGPMPITLLTRARQHIDNSRGAQLDLRLSAGALRSGPVGAGLFAQATWANAKSTDALYGVSPQASAATGFPAFRAGGGLLFASVGALGSIDLSPNWVVVGSIESRHLHGSAARSPLAERGSGFYASAGLAQRF